MSADRQDPGLAYHRLRVALARFSPTPAALGPREQAVVERAARREHGLEERVLGAEEAREVMVPDAVVDTAVAEIRTRYDSATAFAEDLAQNGLDETGLRRALAREPRVEAVARSGSQPGRRGERG